jgi:DNA polymerase-3 subunit alpha
MPWRKLIPGHSRPSGFDQESHRRSAGAGQPVQFRFHRRELCDTAQQIEGMTRHASRHACGVVIGKEALDELVPLEEKDGDVITQYHAKAVEKIGLVKMDFLGLQNNTVINDTLELIEARHGRKIDLENIDLTDKKVYDMLGKGDGIAVFQMEGTGMRALLRDMKPENLEHIIAQISLYRPGPMEEIPKYISGRSAVASPIRTPSLKEYSKTPTACCSIRSRSCKPRRCWRASPAVSRKR